MARSCAAFTPHCQQVFAASMPHDNKRRALHIQRMAYNPKPLADFIKSQLALGVSTRKLADMAGVDGRTIRAWRDCERPPRLDNLYGLADGTGVPVMEILGEDVDGLTAKDVEELRKLSDILGQKEARRAQLMQTVLDVARSLAENTPLGPQETSQGDARPDRSDLNES